MAECRACLVKNVRMHLITNTRYREMFEKLTGNKLSIEDGRPETICYICNAQLQRCWRFFETSQRTEKMLTTRILFGIEMQDTADMYLTTTPVKAVSFVEDGSESAPEVTVTVKEELDDVDEWERFKDEFMDSPSDFENNDDVPITMSQTEETKTSNQDNQITKIINLKNTEERELKNELLDFIKTESVETNEDRIPENMITSDFKIKTERDNLNIDEQSIKEDYIKEEIFPIIAGKRCHIPKPKLDSYYYCDECEYRCQQSKTLRKHRKHHDVMNQFSCEFCLYRFPDELKLARHRNYCTVCNICGKKFHNLNGLRIHVRLHTGEQPFSCDLCGRGFNQKTNLQTHLRVHAREKQYPCEICHKIFPFSSYLKRHMLIHSDNHIDGESMHRIKNCHKLFSRKKKVMVSCTVCGKILRKDSMSMHMRLHTGDQPFSCEKCHRFFNQKCNLLTHVERCHPGDPLFACKVCFKTFAMNSELRKHMETHGVKVEIKEELLAQTEKTIKKFISMYEKEVEQRLEVLSEADKKMELIFNLGLKPRDFSQEPNGRIVIPNFDEGHNVMATKRKGCVLDSVIKKAKRKATEITVLRDSVDGIKTEGFSPNNTQVNIGENNFEADKIIKREVILLPDRIVEDGQENDLDSPDKVTCTDINQEIQRSDSKAHDQSNDSTKNTEMCNTLTTDDFPHLNCIFVATNSNKNIENNKETQNIAEVEIKRELIADNEELPENKEESVDTTPTVEINLTNEVTNEKAIDEGVSIKTELAELVFSNEINTDDIEYFDDGLEIVEVEISDSEEYTNLTEQNSKNEDIAFTKEVTAMNSKNEDIALTNEDLEVTAINFNPNALAGTDDNKSNEEVLATKEVESTSQVLVSDDNLKNELDRRHVSPAGVELSVIDPDDVDNSMIDSEQEYIEEDYLDISDDELINTDDDSFDDVEVPSDNITDSIDARDKSDITDTPKKLFPCNEPRIKLRGDLFAHSGNLMLNGEDSLEANGISPVNSDSSTNEAYIDSAGRMNEDNIDSSASNDELDVMTSEENHSDEFNDAEYLDIDSSYDPLDTVANNVIDTISNNHFDDSNAAEDIINDSNDAIPISAKDFEIFQQKHIISVHKKMNNLIPPYPCDLCVTKVLSY